MFELKIITQFSAAHQLKMVSKKCENLHGHNWKIEVCVAGKELNPSGVLMDFGEIKIYLSEIMDRLDHKFLNELDYFQNGNPSSENIAQYIAGSLQERINNKALRVTRVTAWESDSAGATFIRDTPP